MKAGQPDLQKEIRLNIASLVSAMDAELEASIEQFVDWWEEMREFRKRTACCRAVPIVQSNPSQPKDDSLHP
jgi:hypothetical protein